MLALAVAWVAVAAFLAELRGGAQQASNMAWGAKATPRRGSLPPRAAQAQRFLAQRGLTAARAKQNLSGSLAGDLAGRRAGLRTSAAPLSKTGSTTAGSASWISVGPAAVETPTYGLVSGRISSLALDPSDAAGNRLYVGTTGGGVWLSVNAGTSAVSDVVFNPLTDTVVLANGEPYASQIDSSISIAALTVQPGGGCATGGTGVILTGTGDPNDALDSYYGAGVLRSTDCGTTWSLIQTTADQSKTFVGEGFAGFAWAAPNPVSGSFISSKVNQNLVVAAVSQAYEGALVNAEIANDSYEGLYYSTDSGATWTLATITDGNGADVEGAADTFDYPHGNAATAVVWNAVRQIFVAAVRYHGYYQSTDGITFTRLGVQSGTAQPGTNLTTRLCPTNLTTTGSEACPIFRGALAVDPESGDTFAWTVDISNQDQGLWRDRCAITSSGACTNTAIAFATQLSTAALETDDPEWGEYTIENGDYNLALAAVPTELDSEADTILLAGANDLWRCSLADSCTWRNTTNATSCMSAKVGEFQHALEWNAANPEEIFIGNDSGLWRSMDAVNESPAGAPEPVCSSTDASHFQNLNGELGSLAESVSLAQSSSNPYAMMTGLGVNGSAGVRDSAQPSGDWPQILSGEGGPTAIDPSGNDWYVNSEAGVFIQKCSQPSAACTAADFGTAAVVDMNARLEDGSTMSVPAPFIVDPLDPTYLLVGTCRVWRVPGDGSGWSASNAVSSILDGGDETYCAGNALIRSIAAMALPVSNALPQGGEVVYVGMYGAENGGEGESLLPGHVLSATIDPSSRTLPVWTDLTSDAVSNDSKAINALELDFSSIAIDPHDPTGQTVYVTVEGVSHALAVVQPVYRSIDGGATWASISSNLPASPVSSLVVDPQDANTVYVATDVGVYSTRTVTSCARSSCWSAFGAGLPEAPVVALSASSATASAQLLTAATYGRGIWQTPLWTAGEQLTTVTATPNSLTFTTPQSYGTTSAAQTVTLKNTGSYALTVSAIAMSGDFSETDTCQNATVSAGASCTIQVSFTPDTNGTLTGEMTISANMSGGEVAVTLSGTGTAAPQVNLAPAAVSFGGVALGNSSTLQVTANNGTGSAIPYASTITGPFAIASSTCVSSLGVAEIPAGSCNLMVQFIPSAAGAATGTLTFTDSAGTQQVALSGSGLTATTDTLSATSLTFPGTVLDQLSAVETVSLTNSGGAALTSIATAASGPFTATNNCSRNLAAASSCTISVFFLPTAAGAASGTLTVTDSASDSPKTVALSGTGLLAPAFTVSPASLSFGIVAVGSSNTQTLKITNTGGAPMANVSFQISGTSASSFATGTTTCGATLAGGSSCTVPVTYTPTASSGSTAMLAISSSTLGVSAATVDLTGNQGEFPASIEVTPTTISFSATGINESSNSKTVTIANPGTSASLSNLTLAVTSGFNLVNNTCAALVSGTLAAQSNCTVGVVFAPASTGAQTGTLTISSSTVTVAATVALSGMGTDFTVAISGATSQTVAKGQTADYSLKITPLGGAQATYAFQCGSLPSNALCLFSPSSETLSGSATGNVTVEISTGQSSASAVKPGPDSRSGRGGALPLLCGVLALPLVWKLHRKAFMAVALLAILAGGVSSCSGSGGGTSGGGGSGGGGTSGGTPAGTYSIPVTVSCNGVQHSVTMTLIVD